MYFNVYSTLGIGRSAVGAACGGRAWRCRVRDELPARLEARIKCQSKSKFKIQNSKKKKNKDKNTHAHILAECQSKSNSKKNTHAHITLNSNSKKKKKHSRAHITCGVSKEDKNTENICDVNLLLLVAQRCAEAMAIWTAKHSSYNTMFLIFNFLFLLDLT